MTQEVAASCLLRGQACPSGTLRALKVEKGGKGVLPQGTQPAPAECGRGSHWGRAALQVSWREGPGATGPSDPALGLGKAAPPTRFCTASLLLGEPGTDPVTAFTLQGEGLPAKPRQEVGGRSHQTVEIPPEMAGGNTEAGGAASVKSLHTPPRARSPPAGEGYSELSPGREPRGLDLR